MKPIHLIIYTSLIFFAGLFAPASFAWDGAPLDPQLAMEISLQKRFYANPSPDNESLLKAWGVPSAPGQKSRLFLYFKAPPDEKLQREFAKFEVDLFPFTWVPPVGAHPFGFMIADAPLLVIEDLLMKGLVQSARVGCRTLKPLNDATAIYTGVTEVRDRGPRLRGEGVRLAILDSGFQLEFADLPEPAAAMDYADYPDTNANVTDIVSGHGTHVAGTAFGSGELSGGRWMGMAPSAEPIYLKIGNDRDADASSQAVVGAVRAAATWCEADIGSMSYGGSDGFNDGTSPEAQAVDWAVGQGVAFFMSAGNSALERRHYSGQVGADASTDPIQIVVKFAPDSTVWALNLAWFDGADTSVHRNLTAVIRDGEGREIPVEAAPRVSSPRGTEARFYAAEDFLPRDSTSFFVTVTNHSDQAQMFHLQTFSPHYYVRFLRFDANYTVLAPSDADSCISVGAFTTRTAWRDWRGQDHDDRTTIGAIANFSSMGPRIDGALKPNICAPGRRTISCRNTDTILLDGGLAYVIISNNGDQGEPADYLALMGTSMSSPAAAGAAALILQDSPRLSPSALRERIYDTALQDEFTGDIPNTIWGWGKIDVAEAVSVQDHDRRSPSPAGFSIVAVYPNPFNGALIIYFDAAQAGTASWNLIDGAGRRIWSWPEKQIGLGRQQVLLTQAFEQIASGHYILEMVTNGRRAQAPVVFIR